MSTHAPLADRDIVTSSLLADLEIGPGSREDRWIGRKAASLAWLVAHGYRVPPFCVLSSHLCTRLLKPVSAYVDAQLEVLDPQDPVSLRRCSAVIRARVTAVSIPAETGTALARHITRLRSTAGLAVRSSLSDEDSARNSFAGQMDTLLNVEPDDVPAAVLQCLASAYSERALFYRAHRGLLGEQVTAAVIVQVMVDSAVSGVVFSCNPQSGSTAEAVVSAGLGLGEGVVSGMVECDTFFVDPKSQSINARVVSAKSSRVIAMTGGGTTLSEGQTQNEPALHDDQVLELATMAIRLADALSGPQDAEWALDRDGLIHVLQTRPVTSVGAKETVFDNVNVAESYPGLTSPLTFTFVQRAYSEVFGIAHRYFGATRKTVAANSVSVYPYLLASIGGRMYYNITNWYKLFLQIPGMDFAIAGWEAALGIENRYKRPQSHGGVARLRRCLLLARVAVFLLYGWVRLPHRLNAFFRNLAAAKSSLDRLLSQGAPAHGRDAHALVAWVDRYMDDLARAYSAQIFNDFVAQQLFRVVEILLRRSGVENASALRNELFCGECGMQSVEPVRSVLELTDAVRHDPGLQALMWSNATHDEVWTAITAERHFKDFHARCLKHIAAYGDRTINELKLETDTLDASPAKLVAMVRSYLRADRKISEMEAREREIRRRAEHTVMAINRSLPHRLLFAFALRQAREAVRQRENMRLGRSRCFGLAKRVYRALGAEFHGAGVLDDPRDIFFLTYQEVAGITRGTFVDAEAHRVVAHRKRDHERWQEESLSSRIVTSGIALAHEHEPEFVEHQHGDVLTGVGCAPGEVRAPALVLTEPTADVTVNGEILVSTTTDPGWVFRMVAASGLVSEKGSILSHTAIIGRELGIPTVVGVAGVTRRVHDGDVVAINGREGTVTIGKGRPQ